MKRQTTTREVIFHHVVYSCSFIIVLVIVPAAFGALLAPYRKTPSVALLPQRTAPRRPSQVRTPSLTAAS